MARRVVQLARTVEALTGALGHLVVDVLAHRHAEH